MVYYNSNLDFFDPKTNNILFNIRKTAMEAITLIPRKIHYCWFGGNPLPESARICIATWKKYCPDYEIVEWNESNFDVNCNEYAREAYEAGKWAFVSDVARLYALVNYGGVYLDTDVELIKPLDDFLSYEAFSGFEVKDRIGAGVMACIKGHPFFAELLAGYRNSHFVNKDSSYDTTPNVYRITNTCVKYGLKLDNSLQTINGFTLFPCDYFYPMDFETRTITVTDNSHCIHRYDGSWKSEEYQYYVKLFSIYNTVLPNKMARNLSHLVAALKFRGAKATISDIVNWFRQMKNKR